jgi:hypothetical protein
VKKSVIREMRAVPRYNVQLPVSVSWREPGAVRPPLNALTRDISTRGMFVISDLEPAEGTLLEFEIDMAWDEQTPLVVVRGAGRVVRTEPPMDRPGGFAVHNVWFQLGEPEQAQALPFVTSVPSVSPVHSLFGSPSSKRHRGLAVVRRSAKNSDSPSGLGETK